MLCQENYARQTWCRKTPLMLVPWMTEPVRRAAVFCDGRRGPPHRDESSYKCTETIILQVVSLNTGEKMKMITQLL